MTASSAVICPQIDFSVTVPVHRRDHVGSERIQPLEAALRSRARRGLPRRKRSPIKRTSWRVITPSLSTSVPLNHWHFAVPWSALAEDVVFMLGQSQVSTV
ncbi:hypothetical protein [Amycolatopsis magusensis]|uniref:hypothetical protein n=1 Tax=Amycolatopsis magusensis TaxID=882444 RepID=UPI003C2ED8DE